MRLVKKRVQLVARFSEYELESNMGKTLFLFGEASNTFVAATNSYFLQTCVKNNSM